MDPWGRNRRSGSVARCLAGVERVFQGTIASGWPNGVSGGVGARTGAQWNQASTGNGWARLTLSKSGARAWPLGVGAQHAAPLRLLAVYL